MKILGIDPGTISTGFGIIEYSKNNITYISSGTINPPQSWSLPLRLKYIYNELLTLIKEFKPDEFAIETAFYGKNVQSALKIGQARGISMLAGVVSELEFSEYSPKEIKKAVVGRGNASKEQVQYMVSNLIEIKKDVKKLDETDALAIAICHAFKIKTGSKSNTSWSKFIKENPERIMG